MTCTLIYGLRLTSDDFWELYPQEYNRLLVDSGEYGIITGEEDTTLITDIDCFNLGTTQVKVLNTDYESSEDVNHECDCRVNIIVGIPINQCSGHYSCSMIIPSITDEHKKEWDRFVLLNLPLKDKVPQLYMHCKCY